MINLDELRRLATEATPGPWVVSSEDNIITGPNGEIVCADGSGAFVAVGDDDARLIAAANPATILALLDEVEKLRKDVGRHINLRSLPIEEASEWYVRHIQDTHGEIDAALDASEEPKA